MQIDQTKYILKKLKRYGFSAAISITVLADLHSNTDQHSCKHEKGDVVFPFKSAIGSLQLGSQGTRADISYASNQAAQFSVNPKSPHVQLVKRIMKYLAGTTKMSITYNAGPHAKNTLVAYHDADYASNTDDKKFQSGMVIMMNGAPIAWGSY